MSYKPGDTFRSEFVTSNPTTGAAVNADSLPTALLAHNGTDDGTVTVTVTNVGTGRYKAVGVIPSGYASGDACQVVVAATVSAVAGAAVVDSFVLDSKRVGDVFAQVAAGVALAAAGLDAVMVAAGINARQALNLKLAAEAGVSSGAPAQGSGGVMTFKDPGDGTTARVAATLDGNGNRTAVAFTPPA